MDRLTGRKAVIFGADGVTQGIATRFIQEGASVAVVDTEAALASFGETGAARHPIASRDAATVKAGVAKAVGDGALDILVIGGGDVPDEGEWKGIDAIDPAAIGAAVRDDAAAALAAAQGAGPGLKQNGGSVIFLFNPAGLYSEGGWGEGPMVHHAKRGLARTLAMEWGPAQVRVNTLVASARTPAFEAYRARNPEQVDWRTSKVAMPRIGDPVKDIGGAAVFLASDDTRYLTGSMIFADGGMFLTTPVVETSVPRVA